MSTSRAPLSSSDRRTTAVARAPTQHRVKSWPHLFEATRQGRKRHDVRRVHERDYRVGDTLVLEEFDPDTQTYTGRTLRAEITYVTSAEEPCALFEDAVHSDYCILSLSLIRASS